MSKAVKLKNSLYLSSTSIVHKRGGGWYYLNNLLDNIYPVGSIFISVLSTNPSEYFGGTWEQVGGGKYLFGIGGTDGNVNPGTTGGTWSHSHSQGDTGSTALTIDQMPAHGHNFRTNEYNPVSVLYDSGPNSWYGLPLIGTQTLSGKELHLTSTGGGKGHKHTNPNTNSTKVIPPYYAVYIWKRVS